MIFHNKYTMDCYTYSLLSETNNLKYLNKLKIWLPNFINKKAYNKFMKEFTELFNEKSRKHLETNRNIQIMMYNRAYNFLPLMYQILLVSSPEKISNDFKERYGHEPNTHESLEPLKNEIAQWRIKYQNLFNDEEPEQKAKSKPLTFEEIISYVEVILDNGFIDRNIKLYQFKVYYDKATKNKSKK